MVKFGIISLNLQVFTVNYGCTLQSYALWRKIKEMGYDVEIVDYSAESRLWMNPKYPFLDLRHPIFCKSRIFKGLPYLFNVFSGVRKWKDLQLFLRSNASVSKRRFTVATLADSDYGAYVVGSDTIWDIRQMKGFEAAFFGGLPCMKKTIAYAPSFGEAVYNEEETRHFQSLVEKLVAVSVREPVNLEAFGRFQDKVMTVLDPTMLFTGSDYAQIALQPKKQRPYVLYYVVYNSNTSVTARVDEYAKSKGYDVIEVSVFKSNAHPRFWRLVLAFLRGLRLVKGDPFQLDGGANFPHRMHYGAGTAEFLGLVQNAEMVVTNSFHGSVFAILFGRKFYNFARSDASAKIKWICSMLGLEDRTLKPNEALSDEPIDYENKVFPRLAKLRESSEQFLKNALERCSKA